jgi:hypothetical protein
VENNELRGDLSRAAFWIENHRSRALVSTTFPRLWDDRAMKTIIPVFHTILTILCFGLFPNAHAVVPPRDGCYPGFTTAEGCLALQNLTTGIENTAVGWYSLYSVGDTSFNTGVGAGTLVLNTGDSNTAVGAAALLLNTSGTDNVAVGTNALVYNDTASENTAVGVEALQFNTDGNPNTAIGYYTLWNNDSDALGLANKNTAVGPVALFNNVDGSENTAVGNKAGQNVITGFNNTYIGDFVGVIAANESNTIRIGDVSNGNGAGC